VSDDQDGFLRDETGGRSSARLLLYVTTLAALTLIAASTFWHVPVPGEAWTILAAMQMSFTIWAAGPRMAQYLVPVAQQAVQSLADMIRARRDPKEGFEPAP
jgi:hypothetical protein